MAESESRQTRPTVSCALCRRRKIRCNRETPCSNCMRSKNSACVYKIHPPQPSRQHPDQRQTTQFARGRNAQEPIFIDKTSSICGARTVSSHPSSSLVDFSTSPSTLESQPPLREIESIKIKIKQLEEQLSKLTPGSVQSSAPTSNCDIETTSSRIGGTFHFHRDGRFLGQPQITRGVTHKTRLFGQSHWINGITLFYDLFKMIEPHLREDTSKVVSTMQRCKTLARVIKSRRAPSWPSPPTAELPTKDVADELVDCYLRTIETVYRILHVPTFRRDYEALWVRDTVPSMAFLVQLKLVFAIGATTYDKQFSLRASAVRWVYEAETWLSGPKFKSRLDIQSLQTYILLLFAQETAGVGGDSNWVSVGALFRRAVYMGLHRDPARLPKRPTYTAEMRRRIWNTILEVTLQSSLTSGGPPLISLTDFDTEPPGNFDDDQLVADDPVLKPEDHFTQVSIAIALRKTFPIRLAVIKFLNDLGSNGTYQGTLRLDAELRVSYKELRQTIKDFNLSSGHSPSRFAIHVVDFLMHRYISSLHVPFFGPALHEIAFTYSRKVVVETSLKIWCAAYPSSSITVSQSRTDMVSSERDDLVRHTLCGSGFYRTVAIQAVLLIAMELRTQLQEEESLGPIPLRPDLLSVLYDAKTWCFECIEAGETNIKGYLLTCVITAHIEALMQGIREDEIPEFLIKAAEEAEERCLPILEEMAAAQGPTEQTMDELLQTSLNTPREVLEDWDFMMSDAMLNPDNTEPMSWMFNDESMQEPLLW